MTPTEDYVVLADGCFDPVHVGHMRYLSVATDLGGELIVNVAPDEAIRAKGREPFQSVEERKETLEAVDGVDSTCSYALAFAIRQYAPRYLVKGSDWAGRLPEAVILECRQWGTTIVYADTQARTSTERLG